MHTQHPEKIIVGISGGVDSAVAALLLQEQGHAIEGLFMKNWEEDDSSDYCSAAQDLADANAVCETLGIVLHTVNFSSEYWERVFERFLAEYKIGRTPNPDVLCNQEIKFSAFLDHAAGLGANTIATGHYARIRRGDGEALLIKGSDPGKDQSYFLHRLDQKQLGRAHFPLGEIDKSDVRKMATEAGLAVHDKPDSTGICFIGERPFREFLQGFLPAQPGNICTPDGAIIGRHEGLMYYTIGQRHGLGIGGKANSSGEPWFVVAKEVDSQQIIAVQGNAHPLLYYQALEASDVHWISAHAPKLPLRCAAQIRYRQPDQPCTIEPGDAGSLQIRFDQPQRAVAPGQSVVFYLDAVCLGGAIIDRPLGPPGHA